MHLFSFNSNGFFLQFQFLDIPYNAIIELYARCCLEILVGLILIDIHDFLLDLGRFVLGLRNLCLLLELVARDVDQVRDVSCRLCVLYCLACPESEVLLLLAHLVAA